MTPVAGPRTAIATVVPRPRRRVDDCGYGVVVVASSTGGPDALTRILPHWELTVPVLVVQHMPASFTKLLAERLDKVCPMPVSEARDGDVLQPGRVLVAPGGHHLRLRGNADHAEVLLSDDAPVHSLRPAADVTFSDAAEIFGSEVLALVLTGMGRDSLLGARAVSSAGGMVLVQDEPTSAVWGMPGEVVAAGLATAVLPLDSFAATVPALCQSGPRSLILPEQVTKERRRPVGPHF